MNFNQSPYFDDFDELKNFYRILFQPGVAVQVRELNQLQSIVQNQITKFGDHVFKDGSMVIPGQVNYNDKLNYVKIATANLPVGVSITDLENRQISDTSDGSGVKALVLKAFETTDTDPITLIVLYTKGNETAENPLITSKSFAANTTLYVVDNADTTLENLSTVSLVTQSGSPGGRSVCAGLQSGVYYINGYFVSVPSEILVIKKYADTITDINARIGISWTDSIVTANDDNSLYDNAAGSPNAAAPGAHRYKISTSFVQYDIDADPENFFELLRVEEGTLQSIVNASQYNILEETLARRTYDESGNYVVDEFKFDIREQRSNNRGAWNNNAYYQVNDFILSSGGKYFECIQAGYSGGSIPTQFDLATTREHVVVNDNSVKWRYTQSPTSNRGRYIDGDSSNLVATFGLGKAYVQGYEISKAKNSNLVIPKARTTKSLQNTSIPTPVGNYMFVDKRYSAGIPDVSQAPKAVLFDRTSVRGGVKFGYGNEVGSARILWTEPDSRGGIKVGLTDVQMKQGKNFAKDVNSIIVPDSVTSNTTSIAVASAGLTKYAGSSQTYLQLSGGIGHSSTLASAYLQCTGLLTAFLTELQVGDVVTIGNSSNAVTSSWTVVAISSNTGLVLSGGAITSTLPPTTGLYIRAAANTLIGMGTGQTTKFQAEFRSGDKIWLGTGNSSTLGTIQTIISNNRMLVTSVLTARNVLGSSTASTTPTIGTSVGTYYTGRIAAFAGDVWGSYQQGVNTQKLTGLFTLSDFSGGTTLVQANQALLLSGTTDASLLNELRVNDLVEVNGNRLNITYISSNTQAYAICLDNSITGFTVRSAAFRITNRIHDANNTTLVFPAAPSTLDAMADNIYYAYRTQQISVINGANNVTFTGLSAATGSAAAEELATTDPGSVFLAQDGISSLSGPISVSSINYVGQQITVNINSTFSSTSARITYPVKRAAAANDVLGKVRSKELIYDGSDEFLSSSVATQRTLNLTNADIYKLVKVYMAVSTSGYGSYVTTWNQTVQDSAMDITSRYELDTGEKPNYYDIGRLKLRPGSPTPTGSIKVFYEYFNHTPGDYFTLASYDPTQVPYEAIPSFGGRNLGDLIDFRTKIDAATGNLDAATTPRYGTNFTADISYYLGRKEKIFLDRNGSFYNVSGAPGLTPQEPKLADNNNSINIANLELRPWTASSESPDVLVSKIDNRRYTMRDIGNIEKRVTNLEAATALSLLETKTKAQQIRDNNDPQLERYKTGFFVDNFADASNAEMGGDARFSLNDRSQQMGPMVEYYSFPLVEKINYTSASTIAAELTPVIAAREAANYAITGDLLTLKYTTSTLIQQKLATTSISVAPFLTATFLGSLNITPDSDIYENVKTVNRVVGTSSLLTTAGLADAISAYKSSNNWRPYRISVDTVNVLAGTSQAADLIPFCRANTILMVAKGLKPNSRFYPFFDDEPINEFITGAVKITFDGVPLIDFPDLDTTTVRAAVKNEWPRWRSLHESVDVKEVVRRRRVWYRWWSWSPWGGINNSAIIPGPASPWNIGVGWGWGWWGRWVYEYGLVHRTLDPKNNHLRLPSSATKDTYRMALGTGAAVYYYENNKIAGSGVAVYQEGTTLYLVNARGKLSPEFIRANNGYDYNASKNRVFYISVDKGEPKYTTQLATVANCLTDDTDGNLYSNQNGVVVALFDLPNSDTFKFLTGKKPVVLTDDVQNDPDNWTSKAEAVYTSEGYNITIFRDYISTKKYVARPYDPIAQSFKLPSQFENGAFITDVDFYFQGKPVAEQAPVQLEIRPCDSTGRPSGTEVVPGTTVTKWPADISIDASKGQVATKFKFKQPVYLLPEKNYALVLKADTKNYRVWIATLGQTDVNTPTSSYTTQATLGSLFKSQDGTLWTEDQLSDLKFNLNRAVFNTQNNATVYVVNHNLENQLLPTDPLTLIHGSNKIRIGQKNHGFANGDTTRLYSETWNAAWANDNNTRIYNIPVGEVFGSYVSSNLENYISNPTDPVLTVSDAQLDSYAITVSTPAYLGPDAVTGITTLVIGGNDIYAQSNVLYHVAKPTASVINSQPTTMTFQGNMFKGFTYDTDQTVAEYSYMSLDMNLNNYSNLDTSAIVLTDINELNTARVPVGNQYVVGGANWSDSFIGKITLGSTTDHVSPAIDMSTFYLDTIQHRIDNPSVNNRLPDPAAWPRTTTDGGLLATTAMDYRYIVTPISTGNTSVYFKGSDFYSSNSIVSPDAGTFVGVIPGRYITVSGSLTTNTYTSAPVLVTGVADDGTEIFVDTSLTTAVAGAPIYIWQWEDYTEEATQVDASGESKFIMKKVNLESAATQIKVIIETNCPSAADFDVYYKTGTAATDFDGIVWQKVVAPGQILTNSSYTTLGKSDTRGNFTDVEFNITDTDSFGNYIDLDPFTAFQIKFVMRSSNAARVPFFRNLRSIAHA